MAWAWRSLMIPLNNGVPNQITIAATPFTTILQFHEIGLYVQNRWTMRQLTVTAGLRNDNRYGTYPSVTVGPGIVCRARTVRHRSCLEMFDVVEFATSA